MRQVHYNSFSQYNEPKRIGNISTVLFKFPHLNTIITTTTSSRENTKFVNSFQNGMYVVVAGLQHTQDNRQVSKKNNRYQLLYPYGVPPDDGL